VGKSWFPIPPQRAIPGIGIDTKPTASRIGALDGLRAIAVSAVVLYHFSPRALPSGYLGVDVFMVVSGYIVTTLMLRERGRTGRIGAGAFWGRRFRRLVPALALMVIAVSAIVWCTGPTTLADTARSQGLASLLYVANWHLIGAGVSYGGALASASPFVHLWSLAVEEQFYLVWPVVLIGMLAVFKHRRWPVIAITALGALASVAWMTYLFDPHQDPLRIYYGTDTRAYTFLFGAVAALAAPYLKERGRRVVALAAPVALVALAAVMLTDSPDLLYRGGFALVAIGAALVTVATTVPGPITAALDRGPLRRLGRVSYGVYLWHWPAVVLVTPERVGASGIVLVGARLGFTALGTAVSWFVIERPLTIARPRRVALAGGFGVGVAAATLVALPVGPAFAYSNMRTDRVPPVVLSSAQTSAPTATGARTPASDAPLKGTARLALPRHGTAMIVGDSGMFSATPAFTTGLHNAGWPVVETAYPGVGLTSLDGRMQDEWRQSAAKYHVDLTIVMLGSWDVAWEQEHGAGAYRGVIDKSLAAFTAGHGKVLWLSVLPGGGKDDRVLDPFYAALPKEHPGEVEYVDIASALQAPDGSTPRVVDGKVLRQLDGWHLCQDGADAVATATLAHLGLATPGWQAGAWRTDGRYQPDNEGCPAS
jgi:peptidoglycan/LPS O-acetylase OafA/YrhL